MSPSAVHAWHFGNARRQSSSWRRHLPVAAFTYQPWRLHRTHAPPRHAAHSASCRAEQDGWTAGGGTGALKGCAAAARAAPAGLAGQAARSLAALWQPVPWMRWAHHDVAGIVVCRHAARSQRNKAAGAGRASELVAHGARCAVSHLADRGGGNGRALRQERKRAGRQGRGEASRCRGERSAAGTPRGSHRWSVQHACPGKAAGSRSVASTHCAGLQAPVLGAAVALSGI